MSDIQKTTIQLSDSRSEATIQLFDPKPWWREAWSDLCTFATVAAIFSVGWWFESPAMQWFGFVAAILIVIGRACTLGGKMSPQEAADFLAERYDVRARDK